MTTESDTALAITGLYDVYAPALLRYLTRLTGSREEAEDLAQETFLKALRHWDQLEIHTSAQAWLFRIARNTAYDSFRHHRNGPALTHADRGLDHLPAPDAVTDIGDAEPVLVALRQLSDHHRVPLLLHSVAGYPLEAIAETLGWKLGTVKSRLYRARAQFRAHYGKL